MRRTVALLATGGALAALLSQAATARQGHGLRLSLIDTAILASGRLTESSGIVPSAYRPGVFWTHNDSGDRPILYATDTTGADLGSVRVAGAVNRDWEDLSAGPCFVAPGRCLYAGDIGDNSRRRHRIVIYRLSEPPPPMDARIVDRPVPLLDSIVLRYPDHAHDAEGLAVTGDGRLLVAVKDLFGPAVLYTASATLPNQTLTRACTLALKVQPLRGRVVTGVALSPDGRILAVRTYVSLHFFRADSACTPITGPAGLPIPVVEPQGEAVTFDGPDRLVLTSERGDADYAPMTRLRVEGLP